MAAKPLHIKAVAETLQSDEYETPVDMAKAVIAKLDELRAQDTQYITVREHQHEDGSAYFGTGPYPTFGRAQAAIEKGHAGLPLAGKVAVVPTFSPQRIAESAAKADTFPEYHRGHWARFKEVAPA